MTENPHPGADDLSALMHGALDEQRAEEVLGHVERCEPCLAAAEALWHGLSGNRLSALAGCEPEDLSALERQVLRRLHAAELGEQATRLASSGFLYVVVRLMAPVFYFINRTTARNLP